MKRPMVLVLAAFVSTVVPAEGQFSDPCGAGCALVLGASSIVFATGTMTAVGRLEGGFSTRRSGVVSWSAGFLAATGAGLGLQGNGARQRRAVYGAGLGGVGGALLGLATGSVLGESTAANRWAATLIGAALGVAAGGIIGATGYDAPQGAAPALTLVAPSIRTPF